MFYDTRGDSRVSPGESCVSGVDWDIGIFLNCDRTPGVLSSFKLRMSPLQVRWDRWDSFPNEAGKWTLTGV